MSLVPRNITRTVKVTTETTQKTKEPNADTLAFQLLNTEFFYIGSANKFAARYLQLAVVNTVPTVITLQYWDGSTWNNVGDPIDQTLGLTRNGFLSWVNQNDWRKTAIAGVPEELFWIRMSVSASLSAGTILSSVLNLYCDDTLVRKYYPDLISDTRYLPEGRTDFLEQYEAARDYVLLRLKQDKIIDDESQVIDPNEVCVAAVHAFAHMLLAPITDPEVDRRAVNAERAMNHELNRVRLSLDLDKSGIIEPDEKNYADIFVPRGGY